MNLFSNTKNIYQKILNVILLIWFIGALIACYANIVSLIIPEPMQSYNEYKSMSCLSVEPKQASGCKDQYNIYRSNRNNSNYYQTKDLLISAGNIIIVGGIIWFINRKKEDK